MEQVIYLVTELSVSLEIVKMNYIDTVLNLKIYRFGTVAPGVFDKFGSNCD